MATETFYFTGEAIFPRLLKPDTTYNANGVYSIGVTLDAVSQAEYDKSGIRLKSKVWKDSKPFYTFKRADKGLMRDSLVTFGPPKVIDKDQKPLTKFVGNGSKVTIKVLVFDTKNGKGHRLDTVRVDELIEYVPQPKDQAAIAAAPAGKAMPF